LNVLYQQKTVS